MTGNASNKILGILIVTILGLIVFSLASPCSAWETKAPQLAEEYAKMLGFKVKDKVGKVAPEIKPGMVIDSSNYKQYSGLKELMPESLYGRLDPNSYAPLAPINIKETDQYHLSRGWIKKSMESAQTIKIGADGLTVEGYVGGYSFMNPKNAVELAQWCVHYYPGDTYAMRPMSFLLYGRDNRLERQMREHFNAIRYTYYTEWKIDTVVDNPEGIQYVGSGVFTYPRDISGTAYVRKRFLAEDKVDEFVLYIPSMRRIRRMSGRDTQDPLFGSDLIWDDYNGCAIKLSTTEFPNDYKMLPRREILLPTYISYSWPEDRTDAGFSDYKVDESGDQAYVHFGTWQRRWVYPIEIISKDPNYVYGKRVIMCEPETFSRPLNEMYDQSGRLWRSGVRDLNLSETGAGVMEDLIDMVDYINHHRTVLDIRGEIDPRWMGPEYTDLRFLSRKAK